jgi:hypothetical protein
MKKILIVFALVVAAAVTNAATWVPADGYVYHGGTPLCTMVIVNGQSQFSCAGQGEFDLTAPQDVNGDITFQIFADGFAPYRRTIRAAEASNYHVEMSRSLGEKALQVTTSVELHGDERRAMISGTVEYAGAPVCAMVLANGSTMFSCDDNFGKFELDAPLDAEGNIKLMVFAAGFKPYKSLEAGSAAPPNPFAKYDGLWQLTLHPATLNCDNGNSAVTPTVHSKIRMSVSTSGDVSSVIVEEPPAPPGFRIISQTNYEHRIYPDGTYRSRGEAYAYTFDAGYYTTKTDVRGTFSNSGNMNGTMSLYVIYHDLAGECWGNPRATMVKVSP